MGAKIVKVSEEAYGRLRALKVPGESDEGLTARLLSRPLSTYLVGVVDAKHVANTRKSLPEGRKRSRERPKRMPPG